MPEYVDTGAILSTCRTYRYQLWRFWDEELPTVVFVGLNPSTADESADDPTIHRCVGFAEQWGFGGVIMVNIYAYRATSPKDMFAVKDPVGPANYEHLKLVATGNECVVCCWGAYGTQKGHGMKVAKMLREAGVDLDAFGFTKFGQPQHPLYLAKDTELVVFDEEGS